jgi:ribokinase
LDVIGIGSLNLDEFWEVDRTILERHHLRPGEEYVRPVEWFSGMYPVLRREARLIGCDPGGSAANTVAALARMGFRTGFFGATGRADDCNALHGQLGAEEDLRVTVTDLPAGRCLALIQSDDPGRDRALVIVPNANDTVGRDMPEQAYFASATWLHLTSFVSDEPLRAQIALLQSLPARVRVSFDPGAVYCARGLRELEPLLRRTTVLFATDGELLQLTGERDSRSAAVLLADLGVQTIVLKEGERGLRAYENREWISQPAIAPVEVKDRTGAGDVAAAGFLAGRLIGGGLPACLRIAAEAASMSISGYGRSAYPDRDLLRRTGHLSRARE